MSELAFEEGTIVEHPKMPALGPGRVTAISSRDVTVYFRDSAEERRFLLKKCPLVRASNQDMPGLEAKPKPSRKRKASAKTGGAAKKKAAPKAPKPVKKKLRPISQLRGVRGSWTRQQALAKFRELFSRGFQDPAYFERAYGQSTDTVAEAIERFRRQIALDDAGRPAPDADRTALAMAAVESARTCRLLDDAEVGPLEALAADSAYAAALKAFVSHEVGEDGFTGLAAAATATGMENVDPWLAVTALPAVIVPAEHVMALPDLMRLGSSLWPVSFKGGPSPVFSVYRQALGLAAAMQKDVSRFGATHYLHVIGFLRIMRQEEERLRPEGAADAGDAGEDGEDSV